MKTMIFLLALAGGTLIAGGLGASIVGTIDYYEAFAASGPSPILPLIIAALPLFAPAFIAAGIALLGALVAAIASKYRLTQAPAKQRAAVTAFVAAEARGMRAFA